MRTCWRRQWPSEQDAIRESSRSSIILCSKIWASVSVRNQQHVDTFLGCGLELSQFPSRRIAQCFSNTISSMRKTKCVCRRDHQPRIQVTFTDFLRRTGALFFSGFKHVLRHAVANGITRKSLSVTSKVDNTEHADHVVLLGVLDWPIMTTRRMVWRETSP